MQADRQPVATETDPMQADRQPVARRAAAQRPAARHAAQARSELSVAPDIRAVGNGCNMDQTAASSTAAAERRLIAT